VSTKFVQIKALGQNWPAPVVIFPDFAFCMSIVKTNKKSSDKKPKELKLRYLA
jgi:hypothetical protein